MNEDLSFRHGHYVYVSGLRRPVDERGQALPERPYTLRVWGYFCESCRQMLQVSLVRKFSTWQRAR